LLLLLAYFVELLLLLPLPLPTEEDEDAWTCTNVFIVSIG
jgi:hypothetical protein